MKTASSGMTILELVSASAITVIIGLSVFGAVYSGRTAWQTGGAVVENSRNVSNAFDLMQREISSMFIFPPGITVDDTGLFYGENEGGVKEFRFYALIPRHSGKWALCRVGYRHNGDTRQIQRLFNVDIHEEKQMVWQPFVDNVIALDFFLYSGEGENRVVFDRWDTFSEDPEQRGRIPDRVEIVVRTRDEKGFSGESEFKVLVPIPAGKREVFLPE